MAEFDKEVVAGGGAHYLSDILFDLSEYIGMPPPRFSGKKVYQWHDMEKWTIKTEIKGRTIDTADQDRVH